MGILLPVLIVVFSFSTRSIPSSPGNPECFTANITDSLANITDSLAEELQRVAMQVKEAFIKGDSALYLKTYTPDACLLAPNLPSLCGQHGLVQFYKNTRKAGIRDAVFTSLGLYGLTGEYVTEQGSFEVFDGDGHSLNKGKLINIWKKTEQGWKIFRQMMNFDAPVPAAPMSKN